MFGLARPLRPVKPERLKGMETTMSAVIPTRKQDEAPLHGAPSPIRTVTVHGALPAATPDQDPLEPDPITITVIAPVHNEAESLPELHRRVAAILDSLGEPWELILVDDGSTDSSAAVIASLNDSDRRVKGISLSRNFGFQVAVTAGLDAAQGDAVVLIDADLQDPPEVIPAMVAQWRAGFDVVYGVRAEREGETWFKKATAAAFYRLLAGITNVNIPVDTGDFRLMDRRVVQAIRQMPEHHRFLRGMVSWVGFRQIGVPYTRHPRHAGRTHFTFRKMLGFALDGITSFSYLPLRVASWLGAACLALCAVTLGAFALLASRDAAAWGWLGALAAVWFVGGIQLLSVGILGEYLGRIHDEARGRPLYLVRAQWGLSRSAR